MNILRWNRKSKNRINPKTIILLIFSMIMTTFAWFAYSKVLEPTLNIHMASWDITYEIAGTLKTNPIEVDFDVLYPTMPTQTVIIDIFNNGETLIDIEHQVKSLTIAGISYEIVPEGSTPTEDNYIVVAPSVLTTVEKSVETTDEDTGETITTTVTEQIYKGAVTNDISRLPFTIEIEHSPQVAPVTPDQYGGPNVPGQGYLKVTVNWTGDHNELDSEWGYLVGNYIAENPDKPAMSVELSIDSYQADPRPGAVAPEISFPSTSTTRPYLPEGFSRVPGTSLATGLVIADEAGNEYVWIEVPRSKSVYRNVGINVTEFTQDITDASENVIEKGTYSKIEDDLREYVGYYNKRADAYTTSDAIGFNKINYTALKQKMIKSIYNHGGFYIGRYEAGVEGEVRTESSTTTTKPAVIKANVSPYNYVTCSQAHSLATELAPSGYTSSLMFGLQWDLVMKYIETKAVEVAPSAEKETALMQVQSSLKTDSTSIGNYNNNYFTLANANVKYMREADLASGWVSTLPYEKVDNEQVLITSGGNSSFCKQNIYDLAGNLSEWTYSVVRSDGAYRGGNGGNYTLFGDNAGDAASLAAGTSNGATANSYGLYDSMSGAKEVGFRVSLISEEDVAEPWGVDD